MQSKKGLMTSRREFVSNAFGIALATALTWQARADQARSIHEQSDSRTSNSGSTTQNRSLTWDVFLSPSIPATAIDLAPGEKERPWPPISSTLISGEHDAVLVDTPITVEQARALANWIAARGQNLTTIYATHGHGDHFFGTSAVLERFPRARFVARPEVIKVMRQQASPESLATFWNPRFPGQISNHLAIAEELAGNVINLEGHDLVSVPLGFTDTASTTCLHVPSIGLIVAGDAAYNGDHLHLSESPDQQKRQEWIAALDKMESLKPRAVIAGHKRVGNDDSPRIIGETRKYIHDFERLASQTTTARELYDEMLKLYPDWINRGGAINARLRQQYGYHRLTSALWQGSSLKRDFLFSLLKYMGHEYIGTRIVHLLPR
jgi:glyoxylase-like metal-dependent hydrolase (beta-lactamase superfamily II)